MKNRIIYLVIILILLSIGILTFKINYQKEETIKELPINNDIKMTIKEDTLTKTSATVIIKDPTNSNYGYSKGYYLKKKINNEYQVLSSNDTYSNMMLYYIDETGYLEFSYNWSDTYGILTNGEYRLYMLATKDNENYNFYVDFIIDDNTKER